MTILGTDRETSGVSRRDLGGLAGSGAAPTNELTLMTVAQAHLIQQAADLTRPRWIPYLSSRIRSAGANADTTYGVALIDGRGMYRLSGTVGSTVFADVLVGNGLVGVVDGHRPNEGVLDLDDLTRDSDDRFEVILSPKRPGGYEGDWFELSARADHLWLRQYFYDWADERPWQVAIERLDDIGDGRSAGPYESVSTDTFIDQYISIWRNFVAGMRERGMVNQLEIVGLPDTSGMVKQSYFQGVFDIPDRHALVLTLTPPKVCRYWSIQLTDDHLVSFDWVWRQTSLNARQVTANDDGSVTFVLADVDLGWPNWLDTCGRRTGTIIGRWNRANGNPLPEAELIGLEDLRLPTPPTTKKERAEALRHRARAAQKRGD